jgi:hypothetical protein
MCKCIMLPGTLIQQAGNAVPAQQACICGSRAHGTLLLATEQASLAMLQQLLLDL